MAKTTQKRSADAAAKAAAAGEEELRHRVRPGIRAMLADLMQWHDVSVISEAVQALVINAHALGPDGSAALLVIPRHEYQAPENVARNFHNESLRELRRNPGDEIVAPA